MRTHFIFTLILLIPASASAAEPLKKVGGDLEDPVACLGSKAFQATGSPVALSPDGGILVLRNNEVLSFLDTATGKSQRKPDLSGIDRHDVYFHPDGKRLLFSLQKQRAVEVLEKIGSAEAKALLRKLANGEPKALLTRQAKEALKRLGD